ncbi:TRAP transporter substrate-binding protein [Effusibacillus lacus]|uniref:C4-dicarboxylate ABC transporter substrate-binding protein n=1 Tax=Effusibacillus lacus TaxID=1348429 RepID=A0A292YI88_9BACL|nr:TRAP transporter substrate-binding protein [Effusibacillus lacus]TCS74747.1 tripartite ATP-independent transporter DctP family solute receptor [Effusibacillus lacus]GAX88559.1 C4-dicarboxylate ABC transporter substrate-binding protein [Effusibacillus lacus]
MKKKVLTAALASVFTLSTILVGCGSNPTSAPTESKKSTEVVELNLGHTLSPQSHYQAMATKLAELAAQKSNGTIKISVFPQSQLGGEVKMIQSARTGSIGMLVTAQAPLENTVKEYSIFDLPYLFDSIDQANQVLGGEVGKKYLGMLPQHGLVGLGWLSVMERNVFSSKPIKSVDDIKSFKIRIMQSPGYVKAYEALGTQPTPMAYSEVYLSLQQGVVDGADTSPDQFVEDKFIEVSKYYNKTKVHYLPALLIISKAKWDKLTPDQQKVLQEAANEALKYGIDYYKKAYDDSIEKMKKAGVQVTEPDLTQFKKVSEKTYDQLLKEIPDGKKLFDEIQAAKQKAGK